MEQIWLIPTVIGVLALVGIFGALSHQIITETRDDVGATECALRTDGYTLWNNTAKLCSSGTTGGQANTSAGSTGAATNATADVSEGLGNVTSKFDTIGTVAMIVIIIGLLFGAIVFFKNRN